MGRSHVQAGLLGVACGLFVAAILSLLLEGRNALVYVSLGGVAVLAAAVTMIAQAAAETASAD